MLSALVDRNYKPSHSMSHDNIKWLPPFIQLWQWAYANNIRKSNSFDLFISF